MDFKLLIQAYNMLSNEEKKYAYTQSTEQNQNFFYRSAIFKRYLGYN